MFDTYIFDLYGTLVDISTDEGNIELWKAMSLLFQYNGAYYTKHELKEAYFEKIKKNESKTKEIDVEKIFVALFKDKGVRITPDMSASIVKSFRAYSTKYIKLYPGVIDFLTHLREQRKKVYLLSNAQSNMTRPEIQLLGLGPYFDAILISSEVGYKKPSHEFFDALLEQYSIHKDRAIMIGNDYQADIVGGYQAGLHTCYLYSNLSPKTDKDREDRRFAEFYFDSVDYKAVEKQLLIEK